MIDLEMTRLCAEAMGYDEYSEQLDAEARIYVYLERNAGIGTRIYDPLHDDAQAMWLVKNCSLTLTNVFESSGGNFIWRVEKSEWNTGDGRFTTFSGSLNRAIVECVAKMQGFYNHEC